MDELEQQAMKEMHVYLAEIIEPFYLRGYLYQEDGISRRTAASISEKEVRHKRAEDFLFHLVDECPMQVFLNALKNMYPFLEIELAKKIAEVKKRISRKRHFQETADLGNSSENTSQDSIHLDETAGLDNNSGNTSQDSIPSVPNKVNVFTSQRNKVMRYKHMLKRLSHDGNHATLANLTQRIYNRWDRLQKNMTAPARDKNKMADLVFMAYDSEVENRRVKYDCSLYRGPIFDEMLKIIPYTSEPKVTSMTYLARFGSAITMKDTLDEGLTHLQFAREHAIGITPCYESGIVIYIEHNLLVQKYQQDPDLELKKKLLKLAEDAIFHFSEENEALRMDYKRMLLLKIAFIHLGIGLFGENMSVKIDDNDLKSAKNCLDCVEQPNLWNGMETRRKMFFHIAKSKYYHLQKVSDLALDHATKAQSLANSGKFNKELANIDRIINELNSPLQMTKESYEEEIKSVMEEFLEQFPAEDREENQS